MSDPSREEPQRLPLAGLTLLFLGALALRALAIWPSTSPTAVELQTIRAWGAAAESIHAYRWAFAGIGAAACVLLAVAAAAAAGRTAGWVAGGLLAVGGASLDASVTVGPTGLLHLAAAITWAILLRFGVTGRTIAAAAVVFAALGYVPRLELEDAYRTVSPLGTALAALASRAGWLAVALAAAAVVTARPAARLVLVSLAVWIVAALLRNGAQPTVFLAWLPGVALLSGLGFATTLARASAGRRAVVVVGLTLAIASISGVRTVAGRWAAPPRDLAIEYIASNLPDGTAILIDDPVLAARIPVVAGERAPGPLGPGGAARAFRPFLVPPGGVGPPESTFFYDPNLALFFPFIVFADLEDPRLARDPRDRDVRELFHAVFREDYAVRAHFPSKRNGEPGITILERPAKYELDRSAHRTLFETLAHEDLKALRDSSDAFTDWLVRGGTSLRAVGELAGADGFLRLAESRDDSRADVYLQLGLVATLLEFWESAKTAFLRALAIDESLGQAHYNLGALFEREDDFAGAETSYRAAIRYLDEPLPAHARLGALLHRMGDTPGAIEELRTIRDIDPASDAFRYLSAVLTDT